MYCEKIPCKKTIRKVPGKKPIIAYSIQTCQIKNLKLEQIIQMRRLCRRGGFLGRDLSLLLEKYKQKEPIHWHRIVIAKTKEGKILGWGLLQVEPHKKPVSNVWMMYIQQSYRRQGIGKAIAKKAFSINTRYFNRRSMYVYLMKDQGGFYKKIGIV